MFNADSIIDSLAPVMFIGRLTGLSPYDYIINAGSSKSLLNPFYCLSSIIFITSYTYCVYKVSSTGETIIPDIEDSRLLKIGDWCRIQMSFLFVMFLYVLIAYKKNLYAKILETLESIDLNFKLLGKKFNYRRIKIMFFVAIIVQYLFQVMYMLIHYFFVNVGKKTLSLNLRISIYSPGLVSCFFLFVYQSLIHVSWRFLEELNKNIIRCMENNQRHRISILSLGENIKIYPKTNLKHFNKIESISLFWEIYVKICDVCIDINRSFSLKVLGTFAFSFVSLVFNLYHALCLISQLNSGKEGSQNEILIYCLHQTSLHLIIMSIPIIMCDICKKKVNCIKNLFKKI